MKIPQLVLQAPNDLALGVDIYTRVLSLVRELLQEILVYRMMLDPVPFYTFRNIFHPFITRFQPNVSTYSLHEILSETP